MLTTPSAIVRVSFLAAAITSLTVSTARAETPLRWKFKEGDKATYSMDQKQISKGEFMGMEIESNMSQTIEVAWAVKGVDSDGVADMVQTIDRFRMKMEAPFGGFEFDSKDGKELEGPLAEIMGPLLKGLVGAELACKVDPQGDVKDVKLPQKLLDAVQNNPLLAQFGSMFSEDGLKQMAQMGVTFPKEAVSKGESWDKKTEIKSPFGTMKIATTSTYAGPETRDGKELEKISLKVEQSIEPAPGGDFEIKIKSQESKGALYFDNKAGRMLESEVKQKLKMEISVMGNTIEQTVESTATVKLVTGDQAKKSN